MALLAPCSLTKVNFKIKEPDKKLLAKKWLHPIGCSNCLAIQTEIIMSALKFNLELFPAIIIFCHDIPWVLLPFNLEDWGDAMNELVSWPCPRGSSQCSSFIVSSSDIIRSAMLSASVEKKTTLGILLLAWRHNRVKRKISIRKNKVKQTLSDTSMEGSGPRVWLPVLFPWQK